MTWDPDKIIGGRPRKTDTGPTRRGRPPAHSSAEKILLALGSRLKAVREEQKMTVAEVARITGIAPQTIIQLEDSGRPIRFPVMFQIAECLGYRLEFRLTKAKE